MSLHYLIHRPRYLAILLIVNLIIGNELSSYTDTSATGIHSENKPTVVDNDFPIKFYGFFSNESITFAAVSFRHEKITWIPIGESYRSYKLYKLNTEDNILYLKGTRDDIFALPATLTPLEGSSVITSKHLNLIQLYPTNIQPDANSVARDAAYTAYPPRDTQRSTEGLDWEWIKSDSNPMKTKPYIFKGTLTQKWRNMSEPEKPEFIELYRQCGWHITVFDSGKSDEGVGVEYKQITEDL